MKQFLLVFKGQDGGNNRWNCEMLIQGNREFTGKLLADYIYREYQNGQPAPMKIFAEMVQRLSELDPKIQDGKIIIP